MMKISNVVGKIAITIVLLQAIALQGCLPSNSQNTDGRPTPANDGTKKLPNNNNISGFEDINASSLMVSQNSRMISLADLAKQSTADITVFHFMGVSCISCMTEGPHATSTISRYGSKATQVVIFPNQIQEYQPSEYQNFVAKYAGNAPYVFDESLSVIKRVRKNTGQYFGVLVLVSKDGSGKILNEENAYLNLDSVLSSALNQR